jgi:hypothetical protein
MYSRAECRSWSGLRRLRRQFVDQFGPLAFDQRPHFVGHGIEVRDEILEPTVTSYRGTVEMVDEMLALQRDVLPPIR